VEVPEDLRFQPIKRIRDSKGVVEAEEAALGYLERNPRQVIRFHRALAEGRRSMGCSLGFSARPALRLAHRASSVRRA
jgi:hypothetical protein